MPNVIIGEKLKTLRLGRKLTQEEVANKIGLTRSTVSNYEMGRRVPHVNELQKIAEVFGVGLDFFGVAETDEVQDVLERARLLFKSSGIDRKTKEKLHNEFMRLYLEIA